MNKLTEDRINQLREVKKKALLGGGEEKIAKQHKKGKMTARERVNYLLDDGSFSEFNMLTEYLEGTPSDGLVAGYGTVNGKIICVYAQDPTVKGGAIGKIHGYKMHKVVERACDMEVPFVGLHDSPGARLPKLGETKTALGDALERNGGTIFTPNTLGSGFVPQISAILGSCAGISVYSPALTDYIYMVNKQSHMFITGPAMVKTVTGETLTYDELGGAEVHCKVSGVCDNRFNTEKELLDGIKDLLGYLPSSANAKPPVVEMGDDPERMVDELTDILPDSSARAYDVRKVIRAIVDKSIFHEEKPEFAGEVVIGFARLDNKVTGIVANQPLVRAGSMTVDSSDKQARFIRFCDSFNIPLLLLVDTPAYMPGRDQEHRGIIRHGAKVLYALTEASVPRIVVVMRKAYGGGNLGMGVVPGLRTDMIYYWPMVEVGVLGAKASVQLHFGREIAKSENPKEMMKEKLQEFQDKYSNPMYEISGNFNIDDVIEPRETRKVLIRDFKFLENKNRTVKYKKRHGNIPL